MRPYSNWPQYGAYVCSIHAKGSWLKNGNFDVFMMTINGPQGHAGSGTRAEGLGGGLSDFWRFESHRRHLRAYKLMSDTLTKCEAKTRNLSSRSLTKALRLPCYFEENISQ